MKVRSLAIPATATAIGTILLAVVVTLHGQGGQSPLRNRPTGSARRADDEVDDVDLGRSQAE